MKDYTQCFGLFATLRRSDEFVREQENPLDFDLMERAEQYSEEAIRKFMARSGGTEYNVARLCEFFEGNGLFTIYGPKGMGKTLLVMQALTKSERNYTYHGYYATRSVPDLTIVPETDIVVIDDIHYLLDDIRAGKNRMDDLVVLLRDAIALSKEKAVVLITEDVFYDGYIDVDEYRTFTTLFECDHIEMWQTDVHSVCTTIGVHDSYLMAFFAHMNPTPRTITLFVKNVTKHWNGVLNILLNLDESNPEHAEMVMLASKRYMVMRPVKSRTLGDDREYVYDFWKNPKEVSDYIWAMMDGRSQRKSGFWVDIDPTLNAEGFGIGKSFTNPYAMLIALATEVFSDVIYSHQSYFDHLVEHLISEGETEVKL